MHSFDKGEETDKDIEHAEKFHGCINKMKECLNESVYLLDIADGDLSEMDKIETYKFINRTLKK